MEGVYLVTDRGSMGEKTFNNVITEAVKGGVRIVQLREKEANTRLFVEEAKRIKKMLAPSHVPLIINDRVDVALAAEADGVHLGQTDMPYETARKILGSEAIIGLSVESLEQVEEAEALDVSYLGVSAIFATPTKTDTLHIWGIEGLKMVREMSRHPLVAIGGIHAGNAAQVVLAGADCIAVVSAICSAPDPGKAASELHRIWLEHRQKGQVEHFLKS